MSKRLKITTIISDDNTGEILSKQESIINVGEEKQVQVKEAIKYVDNNKPYTAIGKSAIGV